MENPFFTVVIPTHNRSSLLRRAVESVLNQTFENFEVIVVDDHSTDDTSTTVRSFSDPRFQYMLNRRSKGACGARNTGIFTAKGKWIAFLDDDDIWLPYKLKCQYDLIKKSKSSVGLVCSDYVMYKGQGKKLKKRKNRPSGWVRNKILFGGCIGCLSSTCVRTDILNEIEGFDETFPSSQDQDLWLRVAKLSEFASVPKPLVYMYQEKRERIGQNHQNKLEGFIMLREKYSGMINKDLRLRHRHESNILTYALLLKNKKHAIKSLPWFLLGIIADFPHCVFTIRTTFLILFRGRKRIYNLSWS